MKSDKFPALQRALLDRRRDNLRLLAAVRGPTELSRKLGYTNGSMVAHLAGPAPSREVTERLARAFEKKLELPFGWFDRRQTAAEAKRVLTP